VQRKSPDEGASVYCMIKTPTIKDLQLLLTAGCHTHLRISDMLLSFSSVESSRTLRCVSWLVRFITHRSTIRLPSMLRQTVNLKKLNLQSSSSLHLHSFFYFGFIIIYQTPPTTTLHNLQSCSFDKFYTDLQTTMNYR
jgi:hypothetical protein